MAEALINTSTECSVPDRSSLEISPDQNNPATEGSNSGTQVVTENNSDPSNDHSLQPSATDLAPDTNTASPTNDGTLLDPASNVVDDLPSDDVDSHKRDSFFLHSVADMAIREYYGNENNAAKPPESILEEEKPPKRKNPLDFLRKKNKSTANLLFNSFRRFRRRKNKKPPYEWENQSIHELNGSSSTLNEIHANRAYYQAQREPRSASNNIEANRSQSQNRQNVLGFGSNRTKSSLWDISEQGTDQPTPTEPDSEFDPSNCTLQQKRSIKRMNIIDELIDTEESYGSDMALLCNLFLKSIQNSKILKREQSDLLIRNALDIFDFHEKFVDELLKAQGRKKRVGNSIVVEGDLKNMGKCLVEWLPKFSIYQEYCIHHDSAVALYKKLTDENPDFRELLERLYMFARSTHGISRLKLEDYLIVPIQRLTRYKMLLEGISKSTETDTEEYELFCKAQDIIHEIVTNINDATSKTTAQSKTTLFLSRLEAVWSLPSRWFSVLGCCLLIGTLEMRTDDGKPKRVGCALFDHYMIIAKAKKRDQYVPMHWFPIHRFNVRDFLDPESHSFMLHGEGNLLEFTAICETEKQVWLDTLGDTIPRSRGAYEKSPKDFHVEQFFVSSFEETGPQRDIKQIISPLTEPIRLSQSSSFNHSSDKRASQPAYIHREFSNGDVTQLYGTKSPGARSQSSVGDIRDLFNVNEWALKMNQNTNAHTRWKSIDVKFEDVCTTPILTARRNSSNRLSVRKASIQIGRLSLDDRALAIANEAGPNPSSRRPSIHLTTQPQPLISRNSSGKMPMRAPGDSGLLPSSSSSMSMSRSSKFFGKVVEKLSHIGTPTRSRRQALSSDLPLSGEASSSRFNEKQ